MNEQQELEILQTLFSNAYIGLKSQDWQRSIYDGSCKYQTGNLKCGIGYSIPEKNYTEDIEGWPVFRQTQRYETQEEQLVLKALNIQNGEPNIFYRMLGKLQRCHDTFDMGSIQDNLEEFAEQHGLSIPDDNYQITYL
jgi:hypothetical protein